MTGKLPALPTDPTLKTFVVMSSMALVAFAISALQGWRERSAEQRLWAITPLVFAIATIVAARGASPMLHRTLSVVVLAVAARNVLRMGGRERWAPAVGVTLWVMSLILARVMFT
jgi:hypothetical protein